MATPRSRRGSLRGAAESAARAAETSLRDGDDDAEARETGRYAAAVPTGWRVEKRLVLGFCARTREMLLEVLESGDGPRLGVAPVLRPSGDLARWS